MGVRVSGSGYRADAQCLHKKCTQGVGRDTEHRRRAACVGDPHGRSDFVTHGGREVGAFNEVLYSRVGVILTSRCWLQGAMSSKYDGRSTVMAPSAMGAQSAMHRVSILGGLPFPTVTKWLCGASSIHGCDAQPASTISYSLAVSFSTSPSQPSAMSACSKAMCA